MIEMEIVKNIDPSRIKMLRIVYVLFINLVHMQTLDTPYQRCH